MPAIEKRLQTLEQLSSTAPWLVMDVEDRPTAEQQAKIDRAIKTDRMMIVFVVRGDTAWLTGVGLPPWEKQREYDYHGNN